MNDDQMIQHGVDEFARYGLHRPSRLLTIANIQEATGTPAN